MTPAESGIAFVVIYFSHRESQWHIPSVGGTAREHRMGETVAEILNPTSTSVAVIVAVFISNLRRGYRWPELTLIIYVGDSVRVMSEQGAYPCGTRRLRYT